MHQRILWFVLAVLSGVACAPASGQWTASGGNSGSSPDDPVPVEPARCDGLCIATAPATYTGPSLFWLGVPAAVPACPPETPHEGIEGMVQGTMIPVLAKECRITPSDLCAVEGLTCAPVPEEDLHLCIHHAGDAPCPADYQEHATLSEIETHMPVTLCCQKPPLAG